MQPHQLVVRLVHVLVQPVDTWHKKRLHEHWQPQVGVLAHGFASKTFRRHADDYECGLVEADWGSENGWIAVQSPLPVVVADHDGGIFLRREEAAESGLDTEDRKIVFAHQASLRFLLRAAGYTDRPTLEQHLGGT